MAFQFSYGVLRSALPDNQQLAGVSRYNVCTVFAQAKSAHSEEGLKASIFNVLRP
jgi:hypothetical protein